MLSSEKRSLLRFLSIYFGSTFSLFLLVTLIFYTSQKHQIIDAQNSELKIEAEYMTQKLRQLHNNFTIPLQYPKNIVFDSAIYNLDKNYIFGSFQPPNIHWGKEFYKDGEKLFYIHNLHPYYLGASYIIISKEIDSTPISQLKNTAIIFLCTAGVFFILLGLFLGKLFIAPMKESMENLNKFIEDTTHELNTPISTILTNIELLDTLYDCHGKKEMRRIEIASKTLSRLYDDLTYIKLNHNYHRTIENIRMSQLIYERIEFFTTLIESKKLIIKLDIEKDFTIEMDRDDAIRMTDNLISNAIKYNKKKGSLDITLNKNRLSIKDTGIGIKEQEMSSIQQRFRRANSSEGGFGIGLDIVNQVVERYNFDFKITSQLNQGTEVTILWHKK